MKKILFGLAALSAMAFGASTGVHNSVYGNNQIDVETRAFIINSGLVITASAGEADGAPTDAIKKAILDHGTLMAGAGAASTETREVYVRKTNGGIFPKGTVVNIALNHAQTEGSFKNKLTHSSATTDNVDKTTIAHKLDAKVSGATFKSGSSDKTLTNGTTLTLSDNTTNHNADFEVEGTETRNIPIELTSTIASGAVKNVTAEGLYTNISTLAVRFSKVPSSNTTGGTEAATYTGTAGTVDDNSSANQTTGVNSAGQRI